MAKTFVIWYNVVETWKASFEAESLEEAQALVKAVRDGEQAVECLLKEHNGAETNKGIDLEFDIDAIEEI